MGELKLYGILREIGMRIGADDDAQMSTLRKQDQTEFQFIHIYE